MSNFLFLCSMILAFSGFITFMFAENLLVSVVMMMFSILFAIYSFIIMYEKNTK